MDAGTILGDTANGNWIGGERRQAADGDRFVLRAAGSGADSLGSWPRSRSPELLDALNAAERAHAWAAMPMDVRCDLVSTALDLLAEDPDPQGVTARALGLSDAELRAHLDALWTRLDGAADADRWDGSSGAVLCAPHWSELFAGLADAVLALEDGHSVCLLSCSPLTGIADRLAQALHAAGLTPGAFSVLHDDGGGALRCAAELGASGLIAGFSLSGPGDPPAMRSSPGPVRVRRDQAFGAGLSAQPDQVQEARSDFRHLSRAEVHVGLEEDLDAAAGRVLEAALGRSVLGGQLPGQAALVTCHARAFSEFTEALLGRLDREKMPIGGLYCDPDVARELLHARELGLDEGAALIGECGPAAERSSPSESPGGSLGWLVFTNVERTMRLASLTRPAPMLLLVRGEG
ncbi:MAG: hypothetical protein ACI8QZ_002323 [Chlamydiales bacterium]